MHKRLGTIAAVLLSVGLPFACFDKPDGYTDGDSSGGVLGGSSGGGGSSLGDGHGGDGQDGSEGAGACGDYAEAFESCMDEADFGADTGFGDPCAAAGPEYDGFYACVADAYSPGMCSTNDGLLAFFDALERCGEASGLGQR